MKAPTAEFTDPRIDLAHWHPIVDDLDVPTPETIAVELTTGEEGRPEIPIEKAVGAVEELGGEAFVRSGFTSAKMALNEGSILYTSDPNRVEMAATELLSQHVMMGMPTGGHLYFRELLNLTWNNYIQEPAHPEVRFFVRDGEVLCHHLRVDIDNQEHEQTARSFMDPDSRDYSSVTEEVHQYAEAVAEAFADHDCGFSVDFVLTTRYEWYLTDMAVDALYQRDGEWRNISEHPGDCEHDLEKQADITR